ncbi:hypothetical protein Celaphus_00006159, partial [Cervus elaphus hippelaphus]
MWTRSTSNQDPLYPWGCLGVSSVHLSSPTSLALTSLIWPRKEPALVLSLKVLGSHTNSNGGY